MTGPSRKHFSFPPTRTEHACGPRGRDDRSDEPCHLSAIDHLAVCLEPGQLERQVAWYERVFGWTVIHREDVRTETSSMNSTVVADATRMVKFALQEPGPRPGQIDDSCAPIAGRGSSTRPS